MKIKSYNTSYYLNMIKEGKHFTYSKFGDGELICIYKYLGWLKPGGGNCDKHQYFNDMGKAMHETFLNEKGYIKAAGERFLIDNKTNDFNLSQRYLNTFNINIDLHNADTFFYKSARDGKLKEIKDVLESVNFIIVSDTRKRKLPIKHVGFIEVPQQNAWLEKDRIIKEMIDMCNKIDNPIFGLSMGMGSMVIQDKLYPIIGNKCTMISFGSIWDPYVHRRSRSYHKEYKNLKL